jgi:hypothetical protein
MKVTLGVALVLLVGVTLGCSSGNSGDGTLAGTWKSSVGDGYTVSSTTISYTDPYKDTAHTPPWADSSFTATIRNSPTLTAAHGVIVFEYTKKPIDGDYDSTTYELKGTKGSPAGNFNAAYWKSLTATSVEMGTALDLATYANPATATLAEATTKFTENAVGSYVSTWGKYTK